MAEERRRDPRVVTMATSARVREDPLMLRTTGPPPETPLMTATLQGHAGRAAGRCPGTPTFFLGVQESNNTPLRVVRVIRGAPPFSGLKDAIDSVLESTKK